MKWKSIPGWKTYYEVSDTGLVRSLPRVITRSNGVKQTISSKLLKAGLNTNGYPEVRLSKPGKAKTYGVHILVALTWLKKPSTADRVCHKDDIGSNNCVDNLYWGTSSSNTLDSYVNGRKTRRVTALVAKRIFRLRSQAMSYQNIADKVALSKRTVMNVCRGEHRYVRTLCLL